MVVAQYFTEFIFYSFLGWVWESIYCTIKEKRWADRGFLFGPVCPIYGSCVVAVNILFGQIESLSAPDFPLWGIFLICMIGSAIAEYATSYVLEKRFHARWWDYSNVPLNIQGRICVPVSIGFGLAGIVVVKYLLPYVSGMHTTVHPLVYEVLALVFALIFGADFALTEASLSDLVKDVESYKAEFNRKAELTYENIASTPQKIEQGMTQAKESITVGITQTKESISVGISQTKESLSTGFSQTKDSIANGLNPAQVKRLADHYVGRMSFNQMRILDNIKQFRSKEEEKMISGMSPTEHLKNALARKRNHEVTESTEEES